MCRVVQQPSPDVVVDLERLLLAQAHAISRRQLKALGLADQYARTLVESDRWQRLHPGVYVAHNAEVTYLTKVWAALLFAGPRALASYRTAAYLHGLLDEPPGEVHLTVPSAQQVSARSGLRIHRHARVAMQRQPGPQPARTTVEETVLDLVSECAGADAVIAILTGACRRRLTTRRRLLAASMLRPRLRWRAVVIEVLGPDGIESVLEWRYFRDVEQAHGLPRGVRQAVRVRGGRRERRDVEYKGYRLIVELDGRRYHDGEQAFRDMARDNASAVDGEVVLRYGWFDVARTPCEVAAQVVAVLRRAGWAGAFRRCPRCPRSLSV